MVSSEPIISIKAASTPAAASCPANSASITPVCTTTVKPSVFLTSAIASTNRSKGTEPSGRQPPLIRQPKPPFALTSLHTSTKRSGVTAGNIVSKTLPPQCLHFNAQKEPVTDTEGNAAGDEQKRSAL